MIERKKASGSLASSARLVSLLYSLPSRIHSVPVRRRVKLPLTRPDLAAGEEHHAAAPPTMHIGGPSLGWMSSPTARIFVGKVPVDKLPAGMPQWVAGATRGAVSIETDMVRKTVRPSNQPMLSHSAGALPDALDLSARTKVKGPATERSIGRRPSSILPNQYTPDRLLSVKPLTSLFVAGEGLKSPFPMAIATSVANRNTILAPIADAMGKPPVVLPVGAVRQPQPAVPAVIDQPHAVLPAGVKALPSLLPGSISTGRTVLKSSGPADRTVETLLNATSGRRGTGLNGAVVPAGPTNTRPSPDLLQPARFIPFPQPATQSNAVGTKGGSGSTAGPAATQPERTLTVQLSGELVVDGRQLGRISANTLARDASLPLSTQSRPNIRSTTMYAGMRVPS